MRIEGHTLAELDDLTESYENVVIAALNRVTAQVALKLAQGSFGLSPGLTAAGEPEGVDDILILWDEEVPELASYVEGVYDAGALEAAHELAANLDLVPGEGIPGVPDQFSLQYLESATNRLQGLGDELWENVRGELITGLQQGESITELAARVQGAAGVTAARARTIARTEIVAASNAGTHTQVLMIVPDAEKTWVATHDGRTRTSHHHADGQTVTVDQTFTVGASSLRFPGDPGGAAGEVINCRCTLVYAVLDDSVPAVTCSCGVKPVTAISAAGAHIAGSSCTCAVTLPAPNPSGSQLSHSEHLTIFNAFMGSQPISPAYGGAKIYKKLQEARATIAAHPNAMSASLANLSDHELLAVVDELYTGSKKFTFTEKYDEWLASPAGKKVVPTPSAPVKKAAVKAAEPTPTPTPSAPKHAAPEPTPIPTPPKPKVQSVLQPPSKPAFEILDDPGPSGDGFAPKGQWGKYGAAGAVIRAKGEDGVYRFLMIQRNGDFDEYEAWKWQLPGGGLDAYEDAYQGAAREMFEEIGLDKDFIEKALKPVGETVYVGPGDWHYTTIAVDTDDIFDVKFDGKELSDAQWFTAEEIQQMIADGKIIKHLDTSITGVVDSFDAPHIPVKTKMKAPAQTPPPSAPPVVRPVVPRTPHPPPTPGPAPGSPVMANPPGKAIPGSPFDVDDLGPLTIDSDEIYTSLTALKSKSLQVNDVVAEAITPNGIPMRLIKVEDVQGKSGVRSQFWENGKWHDNTDYMYDWQTLELNHPQIEWHLPNFKYSVGPPSGHVPGPAVVTVTAPAVPAVTPIITPSQRQLLLTLFKETQPVTPGWGGSKVYKQLQELKLKVAGTPDFAVLTDRQLLQLMDEVAGHKTAKTYESVVVDWLNSPAGKKYAGGGPEVLDNVPVGVPQPTMPPPFTGPEPVPWTPASSPMTAPPTSYPNVTAVSPPMHFDVVEPNKKFPFDLDPTIGVSEYAPGEVVTMSGGGNIRIIISDDGQLFIKQYMSTSGHWTISTVSDKIQDLDPNGFQTWYYPRKMSAGTPTPIPNLGGKAAKKAAKKAKAAKATKVGKAAKKAASINQQTSAAADAIIQSGGDISVFDDLQQLAVFKAFKNSSSGSYLTGQPKSIFNHLSVIKKQFQAKGGKYEHITELQILRIIDAQGAKKLGVPDGHLFENKITTWLQTQDGKKHANDVATGLIDPGAPTPSYAYSPPTPQSAPAKVPTHPKPATPSLAPQVESYTPQSSRTFDIVNHNEVLQIRDEMFAQQGDWTAGQRSSLRYYTSNQGYSAMNNCLRGFTPCTPATLKHVKDAQAGMRRLMRNIKLHRGTNADEFPGFSRYASLQDLQSLVGRRMRVDSFSSSSYGGHAAFGGNVIIEYDVPAGTPLAYVQDISHYPGENELLLGAGIEYDIVEVIPYPGRSGTTLVRVRVIVP